MFLCTACTAEGLEVEHDVFGYTVLVIDNYVWKKVPGQSLFRFRVTAYCPTESAYAFFKHDLRVSKTIPDHIDHCLVDVHERTSPSYQPF
jgi:hypothetical protein